MRGIIKKTVQTENRRTPLHAVHAQPENGIGAGKLCGSRIDKTEFIGYTGKEIWGERPC